MSAAEKAKPADSASTIVAMSALIFAASMTLHEFFHAMTLMYFGADNIVVYSATTDFGRANAQRTIWWSLFVYLSGPAANLLLAVISIAILNIRKFSRNDAHFFVLMTFCINSTLFAGYMFFSSLAGGGDWGDVVRALPNSDETGTYVSIAAVVLLAALACLQRYEFSKFTSRGGLFIAKVALLATVGNGLLGLLAAGDNGFPFYVVGVGFGAAWPLFVSAALSNVAVLKSSNSEARFVPFSLPWVIAGLLVSLIYVFVVGRGVSL